MGGRSEELDHSSDPLPVGDGAKKARWMRAIPKSAPQSVHRAEGYACKTLEDAPNDVSIRAPRAGGDSLAMLKS